MSLFDSFIVKIALGIVRGFMNETIGQFSTEELYDAIVKNQDLWTATPDGLKEKGRDFKKLYGSLYRKYSEKITTELILSWLLKDHPDLHRTLLDTSGGASWIKNQVEKIKREIFEL